MNIFGIGLPEMAVIAAIALLVFGPKRLPEMGKTLGRTLKGFQTASQEFEQEFRSALRSSDDDPLTLPPPAATTSTALAPQGDGDLEDGAQDGEPSITSTPSA
ncbi:MAG: TatA/E family twin arginine-targeting protein translocase [Cyanobacteriota bacterium]|nr:TatA/E family twin arginine-targeting protein translocase [Cyanobacteriota bacterium]